MTTTRWTHTIATECTRYTVKDTHVNGTSVYITCRYLKFAPDDKSAKVPRLGKAENRAHSRNSEPVSNFINSSYGFHCSRLPCVHLRKSAEILVGTDILKRFNRTASNLSSRRCSSVSDVRYAFFFRAWDTLTDDQSIDVGRTLLSTVLANPLRKIAIALPRQYLAIAKNCLDN